MEKGMLPSATGQFSVEQKAFEGLGWRSCPNQRRKCSGRVAAITQMGSGRTQSAAAA
jgi:hypothetical protein